MNPVAPVMAMFIRESAGWGIEGHKSYPTPPQAGSFAEPLWAGFRQNARVKRNPQQPVFGVVAALAGELGGLRELASKPWSVGGVRLSECELEDGTRLLLCVSGPGKVRAAAATATLIGAGATRGLFVVGLAGGLRRGMQPGDGLHCTTAVQADSALGEDRRFEADPGLRTAWQAAAPGGSGWFLTADRPVFSPWRRMRLARAFAGACVADMETAAVAAVAARAGVPWAAMRVVSDLAGFGGARAFRKHFPSLAGRAADTLATWVPAYAQSPQPTPF
jgi:adenosylhomocysteine nucleosidase